MNREPIRTWRNGRFQLELFDSGRCDWRGQSRLAYTFRDNGNVIFEGADFAGSPLHADDSSATVAALLSFLTLRPGDTDREYFERYTPEQLDWARVNGEELSMLAHEMEEQAGRGMVACSVETHYGAWLVTFDSGATLPLQTDYDQAAFAVNCGAIEAPDGWDGLPSKLGEDWASLDPSTISYCPDDYLDVAQPGEGAMREFSAKEFRIVALRDCPLPENMQLCDTPERVEEYWRRHVTAHPAYNPDVECFVCLLLNTRRRVKGHVLVSTGTLDTLLVHPREVFRPAIIAAAAALVIAHNHPSGDVTPSEADIKVTRDLIRAGQLLRIELLDHVIIGAQRHASLRAMGYFSV